MEVTYAVPKFTADISLVSNQYKALHEERH